MRRRRHPGGGCGSLLRDEAGFTLFEVLMASVILVVGLVAMFGLLDVAVKATANSRAREGATNLARQILEDARSIPYAQLSPTAVTGELQAMSGLEDHSSAEAGWQIERRDVNYTVTVTECSIDDAKDGLGKHDSTFCKESFEKEGTADSQPADLKRITAKLEWTFQKRKHEIQQVATTSVAGESVGLSSGELKLSSPVVKAPTEPVITIEPAGKELKFQVTAPSGTQGMAWLLEGATQSPAPTLESGTTWTFSWPITGVSDGTYTVGVQAINAEGVKGPPVSIPVILIRNVPIAPKVAAGGFNTVEAKHKATKVVELEWTANSERNVIGYRVYNPSKELVCPGSLIILSTATTCIDLNAPAMGAANLTYEVVALYYAAEGELLSKTVSQGKVATFAPERTEEAPKSPRELKLVTSEGNVTLSWQPPEAGGAAVSFYRIYRGSTEYSSRIAATTSTTYTDPNPETSHEYWVTAVSSKLAESKPIGPVFG